MPEQPLPNGGEFIDGGSFEDEEKEEAKRQRLQEELDNPGSDMFDEARVGGDRPGLMVDDEEHGSADDFGDDEEDEN